MPTATGFRLHSPSSILHPLLFAAALHPSPLLACATCYGQSDAPMASGMNWGILSLLAIITTVLACFAGFFLYLIRRAANLNPARAGAPAPVAPKRRGGKSPVLLGPVLPQVHPPSSILRPQRLPAPRPVP